MGKTKIKTIDDSALVEEPKKKAKKLGRHDDALVEKLKAELGISDETKGARGDGEEGSRGVAAVSETSEDAPRDTEPAGPRATTKTQKPGKAKPRSKKYLEASKELDRSKFYPLPEALDLVKKVSYANFNSTLEAHINTGQMGLRGFVSLPFASAKSLRILVFPGSKLTPADKKGLEGEGIIFGDDSTIEEIAKGKVDFDVCLSTAEWMPKLAKVAKILGPKSLMPNPKNGTIVSGDELKKAVMSFQTGKTEYKTEPKGAVIHLGLGKLNQPNEELESNVKILLQTLGKSRVKKVSLSPTMGPAVKLDLASI